MRDTGIGITPEKVDADLRAFCAGWGRIPAGVTAGPGLASRSPSALVELMGGAIWVESEVGYGSTFHFTAELQDPGGRGQVCTDGPI